MPQDKQVLIQLVNMLAGTLQGIGQRRQQGSQFKAQAGMQQKQMQQQRELALKQLDQRAAELKSTNTFRTAQMKSMELDDKETQIGIEGAAAEAEWQMEREAKTETMGDVTKRAAGELTEGTGDGMGLLNSIAAITKNFPTSTRTMMEGPQTTPGMTKAEFIAR
ncbi:unnamed protein product, partial [marine sediment metagenome]